MPPKRKHQIYDDNDDEGVKVIKFKKQNIDDRDEAIKTLKILPEETESVICDCMIFLHILLQRKIYIYK